VAGKFMVPLSSGMGTVDGPPYGGIRLFHDRLTNCRGLAAGSDLQPGRGRLIKDVSKAYV